MNGKEELKRKIIKTSRVLGIDKIGFTTAQNFSNLEKSLIKQKELGFTTGFEHPSLKESLHPKEIFNHPKTIISIALAYPTKIHEKIDKSQGKRGSFARVSWGEDYHKILKQKMQHLVEKISELIQEGAKFKLMVDTGELIDVAVAKRAGVGFIGKNGLLITEEFGSFVYLGEIVTNLKLTPDNPKKNQCEDCTRCLDHCPTGALLKNGPMNGKRCLSYQTQTKGYMLKEFRKLIRSTIYGCDICQLVCPFNKSKDFHFHREMEPSLENVYPLLKPLLTITNKEFQKRFGKMSAAWRGKKPLQRNAIIALANHHDTSAIVDLCKVIKSHPVAMIRGTAAWSIFQLVPKPSNALKQFMVLALRKETDDKTREEFQEVLKKWRN